ncbi:MAG: DNA adenine methylase [Treponema sp.]|jgi:DNA adenine methylase|nr:DNA adenine methylase [Treponema sp.]
MVKDKSPMKPYLKWAGGKRQLLPEIEKNLPPDMAAYTYYEPFVGAGAVLFHLRPRKAVINDSNTQLIMTYRAVKDHVDTLVKLLDGHRRKNSEAYYYQIRDLDRNAETFKALGDVEKAARLIFLNKTCYNGLYRVNSRGLFNVPYGKYRNPVICEEAVLRRISAYLNAGDVTILNRDFEAALSGAGRHSFIYFDPPYHSPDKSNFTGYQAGGFGEDEQRRLRDLFARMTEEGAECILSNADTEFIRDLYRDFEVVPVRAKRAINSDASGRGFVNEILVMNRAINRRD